MKCNVTSCYWNMWSPKHEKWSNENSMVCVSESLSEHCDENEDFEMMPDSTNCPGYLSYFEFCGARKGD